MKLASARPAATSLARALVATPIGIVLAAFLCLSASGCINTFSHQDSDEDGLEVVFDITSVSEFIRQTEAGQNVSQFSLGWFIDTLLIDIAARDEELFRYFHRDGLLMSSYLQTTFQSHPEQEIATIDRMAQQGNTTLRLAARHALGALLHIPNTKDSPDVQENDRHLLLEELIALREMQEQAQDENSSR
ncbi:hypothetical protein [Magnetospirillum molischianum]|nr:hypothetical protein [Magnetospirillum molischianum]